MDKRFKPMTPTQEREIMLALKAALPGMQIGDAVSLIIEKMHITAPDLAKLTGVSERFLRDTAAGRGNPSIATANKILRAFGMEMGVVSKPKNDNFS